MIDMFDFVTALSDLIDILKKEPFRAGIEPSEKLKDALFLGIGNIDALQNEEDWQLIAKASEEGTPEINERLIKMLEKNLEFHKKRKNN